MNRVIAYEVLLSLDWHGELLCTTHYKRTTEGGGYIAGSALTSWKCKYCSGQHVHSNTAHPQICLGCAIQHNECQRCLIKLTEDNIMSKELRETNE